MNDVLRSFGARWNRKTKSEVAFEPEAEVLNPDAIPLGVGFEAVDLMLGGGMPRGRTSVVFGESSAGKTLLAQVIIAATQRAGGIAMFFDIERTYDAKWFALTGVDTSPEKLLIMRPESLEQSFDMICDALKKVKPEVIIVDSVAAMVPQDVLKASMEEKDFRGLEARKITAGVKKATQFNLTTALIFINQLRVNMGVKFGNPESMPGGKALKFHSSVMIRVRKGTWITDVSEKGEDKDEEGFTMLASETDAKRIGFVLKLRTEKNKCAPPWQDCSLKFFFNGVIDPLGSLIHLAQQRGIIEVTSSWFKIPGVEKKLHGLPAVEEAIRENDELKDLLISGIKGEGEEEEE